MTNGGLGVGKKITIVALTFTLPIAVLCFLVLKNINEQISFGTFEKHGNAYQRPLEGLLSNIQEYQILSLHKADQAELGKLKESVTKEFDALESANKIHGTDLQFTAEGLGKRKREDATFEALKKGWETASAAQPINKEEFDKLIATIRTMITHAGDTSNLILDPDLDSYYLMDVTLLALPQTQQRIGDIINYAIANLNGGKLSNEQRVKFAVFAAMLKEADLDRTIGSTQTSLNEDANFYGLSATLQKNIPVELEKYTTETKKFIELVTSLSQEGSTVTLQDLISAGLNARRASFGFWFVAVDELDQLINTRIESYENRKFMSFLLSGLALLVACGLSYFVANSIVSPLNRLVALLGPGATLLGQSVKKIAKVNSEKADPAMIDMICDELDAHAADMKKTVSELEKVVQGHSSKT